MKRVVLVGLGLVALMAAAAALVTLADAGAFRTIEPHGFDRCARVPVAGAEDLVFDADSGLVLLSSTDFRALERGATAEGAILAFDPAKAAAPVVVAHDLSGAFHPHGLGLWRFDDGRRRLFVVNHPKRETSTVESFDLEPGPALKHRRTVSSSRFVSMNDVAPVGPEAFFVTLDAGTRAGTAARLAETFLRLPWAGVGFFDGATAEVAATGLRYANGVAVTPDGATVFVTETTGRRLLAFTRTGPGGALTLVAEHAAATGLDNLSLDPGGLLWVAAHPKMLDFLGHAADAAKRSPSQVLRARYDAAARRFDVDEVGLDDGAALSGSSVALPLGAGRALIGSVFEHVLDCRFGEGRAP
ncbi:MAG: SMP-30/gluconolactonase/LRE family protein [Myxococcaceae bacterium]|jgi:arylesterase/paraoxonase|nr:SMP-30/gluconolactonase/LRE family protein [Myxococcaceae bacterium]